MSRPNTLNTQRDDHIGPTNFSSVLAAGIQKRFEDPHDQSPLDDATAAQLEDQRMRRYTRDQLEYYEGIMPLVELFRRSSDPAEQGLFAGVPMNARVWYMLVYTFNTLASIYRIHQNDLINGDPAHTDWRRMLESMQTLAQEIDRRAGPSAASIVRLLDSHESLLKDVASNVNTSDERAKRAYNDIRQALYDRHDLVANANLAVKTTAAPTRRY